MRAGGEGGGKPASGPDHGVERGRQQLAHRREPALGGAPGVRPAVFEHAPWEQRLVAVDSLRGQFSGTSDIQPGWPRARERHEQGKRDELLCDTTSGP